MNIVFKSENELTEANDIINSDHDDWTAVAGTEEIVDQGRWDTHYTGVFKHCDGKHYCFNWSRGSTEGQWREPYEDGDECIAEEVELKEVVVKQWVEVNDG